MEKPPSRTWPFVILAILVCVAAGLVETFFGALAAGGYEMGVEAEADQGAESGGRNLFPFSTGIVLGAVSGILVGAAWCWPMIRLARRGPGMSLVGNGILYGILAGVGSTVVLHLGLVIATREANLPIIGIGFLCGVVAGFFVGLISGLACWGAQVLAFRREYFPF